MYIVPSGADKGGRVGNEWLDMRLLLDAKSVHTTPDCIMVWSTTQATKIYQCSDRLGDCLCNGITRTDFEIVVCFFAEAMPRSRRQAFKKEVGSRLNKCEQHVAFFSSTGKRSERKDKASPPSGELLPEHTEN